jgi:hypothetical protein
MKNIKLIFILLLIISCSPDNRKQLTIEDFSFGITHDTGMFFKNVRLLYYDFQEIPPGSGRYAYRFKNRDTSDSQAVLYPTIVVDWLNDEATILIEPNNYPGIPLNLHVKINCEESDEAFIVLDERGKENMLEFANRIYEAIVAGCILSIEIEQEFIPLLESEKSREAFRKTMLDYFNLVRIR